jgi:redox-sensitive bicupin YhaK (pirin superfamily)
MIFVYILSGKIEIENHELNKSDFLVIEEIKNSDLKFQSKQKSEFIITEISI